MKSKHEGLVVSSMVWLCRVVGILFVGIFMGRPLWEPLEARDQVMGTGTPALTGSEWVKLAEAEVGVRWDFAISSDMGMIALATGGVVELYDGNTYEWRGELATAGISQIGDVPDLSYNQNAYAIGWSADGSRIAVSGPLVGGIEIWVVETAQVDMELELPTASGWS